MQEKLNLRIRQLYQALDQVCTENLDTVKPRVGVEKHMSYVAVDSSGGRTDAELANNVSLFVSNIACLKDYLKVWCAAQKKQFGGDALIKSNRDVGIIHDLWIRDKHFELNSSRTGLSPEIRSISRVMRLRTQAQEKSMIAVTIDPRSGKLSTHGDGKVEIVVDADVVDSEGRYLGKLMEIAGRAIAEWEKALVASGVALPPR